MPFIYNKHVTGRDNIGRKSEAAILGNLLSQGENAVIYEPPKTGKKSLLQQTLFNIRIATHRFSVVEMSLLNTRTAADFCLKLGSEIIKSQTSTSDEYAAAVEKHLSGTHFVFDPVAYETRGAILSPNWDLDDNDIRAIAALPYRMAMEHGQKIIVILYEFQNIMLTDAGERVCRIFEDVFKTREESWRELACYVFIGSAINAMKYIFETRHFFWRQVCRVKMSEIDSREIIDHVIKVFLSAGKVLDRDLMVGVCKLFRNNIFYINHFAALCDSLSKGYIMEPVLEEALSTIIAIYEPGFIATMNDLTTYQVCLLKAILDGHTRFSSSEVIKRYSLSSSANVKRLKEALCKKEIITFNEADEPSVIDPLFEYWARKYFFEMKMD